MDIRAKLYESANAKPRDSQSRARGRVTKFSMLKWLFKEQIRQEAAPNADPKEQASLVRFTVREKESLVYVFFLTF